MELRLTNKTSSEGTMMERLLSRVASLRHSMRREVCQRTGRSAHHRWVLASIAVLTLGLVAVADEQRDTPPDWSRQETSGVFFEDAFREALVGKRPDHLAPLGSANPSPEPIVGPMTPQPVVPEIASHWRQWIEPETLEDEVKRLSRELEESVTTPADFAGKGYLLARRQCTILTILFGVIHQYDGSVRWKEDAAAARDHFAQVASVAKVGSMPVYQAAKSRLQDLKDLVRGESLSDRTFREDASWGELVDRAPIMQQMELDFRDHVSRWTANATSFQQEKQALSQRAQILAILTQVLTEEGMQDADDDEYVAHCRQLQDAARSIIEATRENNYGAARMATSTISRTCDSCHESYRE